MPDNELREMIVKYQKYITKALYIKDNYLQALELNLFK